MSKSNVQSIPPESEYCLLDLLTVAQARIYQAASITELLANVLKPEGSVHDGAAQAVSDMLDSAWGELEKALEQVKASGGEVVSPADGAQGGDTGTDSGESIRTWLASVRLLRGTVWRDDARANRGRALIDELAGSLDDGDSLESEQRSWSLEDAADVVRYMHCVEGNRLAADADQVAAGRALILVAVEGSIRSQAR